MKKVNILIYLAISMALGSAVLIVRQGISLHTLKRIQSDYEIKEEVRRGRSDVVNTWDVSLILAPQSYSKNRIEDLFNFFSSQHPSREERLMVYIYTSEEDWQNHLHTPPSIPMLKKGEDPLRPKFKSFAKAIFYRPNNGDVLEDHDKIWYIYSPNISEPDERETYGYKENSWERVYPNQLQ